MGGDAEGWETYFDEYYEQNYFYHRSTGVTTWEIPEVAATDSNEEDSVTQLSETYSGDVPLVPQLMAAHATASKAVMPGQTPKKFGTMSRAQQMLWDMIGCQPCCSNVDQQEVYENQPLSYQLVDDEHQPTLKGPGKVSRFGVEPRANMNAFQFDIGTVADPAEHDEELIERPEVDISGGSVYKGQWKGTQCHGYGTLRVADGSHYDGEFKEGRADGYGKFVSKNGNVYEGQWKEDRAHGRGKYTSEVDGMTYEGQWVEDKKCGDAIEKWSNGTIYEGQFLNDKKHGSGSYKSPAGITYQGQFADDRMDGKGTYTFADGRVYCGEMQGGYRHGSGVMEWPNGLRYEGTYTRDFRHGEGTMMWPDGRVYNGQWSKGKQHGSGVVVDVDGKRKIGHWKMGMQTTGDPLISKESTPEGAFLGGA